jgi:hypothetical protein
VCEGVSEYCVSDNVITVPDTLFLISVPSITERNNGWKLTQ